MMIGGSKFERRGLRRIAMAKISCGEKSKGSMNVSNPVLLDSKLIGELNLYYRSPLFDMFIFRQESHR